MGGFHSPFDVFDMFFGTGHGPRRGSHGERKGKDMIHQLKVHALLLIHMFRLFSGYVKWTCVVWY